MHAAGMGQHIHTLLAPQSQHVRLPSSCVIAANCFCSLDRAIVSGSEPGAT